MDERSHHAKRAHGPGGPRDGDRTLCRGPAQMSQGWRQMGDKGRKAGLVHGGFPLPAVEGRRGPWKEE